MAKTNLPKQSKKTEGSFEPNVDGVNYDCTRCIQGDSAGCDNRCYHEWKTKSHATTLAQQAA